MKILARSFSRLVVCLAMTTVSVSSWAQINSINEGWYRIKNVKTQRFCYLMDDKGYVDEASTSADLDACITRKNIALAQSDPASVIYFRKIDGGYAFEAQGTSTWNIVQHPIKSLQRNGHYRCYASKNGVSIYLVDPENPAEDEGALRTTTASSLGTEAEFDVLSIDSNTDNFVGINPQLSYNGKYYQPYYVSYPFSFASSGMKAYIVTRYENGKALLKEVTTSVIPAKTPVIIECSSNSPSSNRLKIEANASALSGNLLQGNFFCNNTNPSDYHYNVTTWDKDKMRTIGVTSAGKLGMVKPTTQFIPANWVFFKSSTTLPNEITFVYSESEFVTMGDVNGDGQVNATDVNLTVDYVLGKNPSGLNTTLADINKDGKITIADVILIINLIQ